MNPFYGPHSSLLLKCAPSGCLACLECDGSLSMLLNILWPFVSLFCGSPVIDYEIQRRAFGRHTSPLARCLTTIDFLGPCLC